MHRRNIPTWFSVVLKSILAWKSSIFWHIFFWIPLLKIFYSLAFHLWNSMCLFYVVHRLCICDAFHLATEYVICSKNYQTLLNSSETPLFKELDCSSYFHKISPENILPRFLFFQIANNFHEVCFFLIYKISGQTCIKIS